MEVVSFLFVTAVIVWVFVFCLKHDLLPKNSGR